MMVNIAGANAFCQGGTILAGGLIESCMICQLAMGGAELPPQGSEVSPQKPAERRGEGFLCLRTDKREEDENRQKRWKAGARG